MNQASKCKYSIVTMSSSKEGLSIVLANLWQLQAVILTIRLMQKTLLIKEKQVPIVTSLGETLRRFLSMRDRVLSIVTMKNPCSPLIKIIQNSLT